MARPVTLFTGQWADLPFTTMVEKTKGFGYDGIELACWGDHFEVDKALAEDDYCDNKRQALDDAGLQCHAISAHLAGQAVLDRIDQRHQAILPDYVWGDGDPDGVNQRAAEELMNTARAAQKFGVEVVNGFTGSSIWHLLYSFPPVPPSMIDDGFNLLAERFNPIMDVFGECGVRFALEVHPTEIAFDIYTAERALEALDNRPEFGFNFDPSHLIWQGVDPVKFIRRFPDRIYHVHIKDAIVTLDGLSGINCSHINFGDARRGWDFRSPGRGGVNFEEIIRALNDIGYQGPLSIEWEDSGMDRDFGAAEACEFTKKLDFSPSGRAFDAAFDEAND
ncbi:sugar phosphate isomerase/epimerase [Roseiconus lacunae]|uniref:Sugar phosphate isomerase/epimerase n=1 Tax=Roseiconus lacunae TaxID=2605694 RepID=A0ABT7PI54_9BACT|nr:sugar phosphate isomerase/epimerase [Roseiconus lacunae]MDM4016179.1 sugar phosphate isomerase/epimerase [Roseiconus lacunae]WRQ51485.1 sugar phosphate isomerase/epimerase [Stieleria sp. HD01]